MLTLVIRERKR